MTTVRHTHGDRTINKAMRILAARLREPGTSLGSPQSVSSYLTLQLATLQHELFGCLFLDNCNRLLCNRTLFRGSLTQTSVYPREVVREALACNAAAVIYYHNHPSGNPDPSTADRHLTVALKSALALVDVKTLDHIVVAGLRTYSFAEKGEI